MERVTSRLGDLHLEAVRDHVKGILVVWESAVTQAGGTVLPAEGAPAERPRDEPPAKACLEARLLFRVLFQAFCPHGALSLQAQPDTPQASAANTTPCEEPSAQARARSGSPTQAHRGHRGGERVRERAGPSPCLLATPLALPSVQGLTRSAPRPALRLSEKGRASRRRSSWCSRSLRFCLLGFPHGETNCAHPGTGVCDAVAAAGAPWQLRPAQSQHTETCSLTSHAASFAFSCSYY